MREFSKNGTFSGYSDRKELFQCRKHSKLSGKILIRKILKGTRESLFSFPVAFFLLLLLLSLPLLSRLT